MPNDAFIGTAILDRSLRPQQLYLIGRKSNGRIFRDDGIPVYPVGSPKPKRCAWSYEVHGNTLHVRPSVRINLRHDGPEYFHNEGFWIIHFEDGRFENLEGANAAILPQYAPKQVGAGIWEWEPNPPKRKIRCFMIELIEGQKWRNAETGEVYESVDKAPIGAMWHAPWISGHGLSSIHFKALPEEVQKKGSLIVRTPEADWDIDSVSSNGTGWVRTGEPPNITVKPSIGQPWPPPYKYHGFLTDGFLEEC